MNIFEYFSGCATHTFLTNERKNDKYYTIECNRGIMCTQRNKIENRKTFKHREYI